MPTGSSLQYSYDCNIYIFYGFIWCFFFLLFMSVSIFINFLSSLAELRHMESKSTLLVSEYSWNFCCVSSSQLTQLFFFKTIFTVLINKSSIVQHANCWLCSSDLSCNKSKSAKKAVNNHLRLVACFLKLYLKNNPQNKIIIWSKHLQEWPQMLHMEDSKCPNILLTDSNPV